MKKRSDSTHTIVEGCENQINLLLQTKNTLATNSWYLCHCIFNGLVPEVQSFHSHFQNSLIGIDHEKEEFKFCLFFWGGKPMSFYMVSAQLNSFWGKVIGHMQEIPHMNALLAKKVAGQ